MHTLIIHRIYHKWFMANLHNDAIMILIKVEINLNNIHLNINIHTQYVSIQNIMALTFLIIHWPGFLNKMTIIIMMSIWTILATAPNVLYKWTNGCAEDFVGLSSLRRRGCLFPSIYSNNLVGTGYEWRAQAQWRWLTTQ